MPRDFLSELMPPNSVPRGCIPNLRRPQLRFDLDPRICSRLRLDFLFLSEFAGADRVNEACPLPAGVVNPTKLACPELLGNMLERCGPLPVTRLRTFARFIR